MSKRTIEVLAYDPTWKERFTLLAKDLRVSLGETALRIDHVGSTSVVEMWAKPIVDIQISVSSLELMDEFRLPLEDLGYIFREDNPDLTKRYFREKPGTTRTHIHVRQAGSYSEQEALLFRDYLREKSEEAEKYSRFKQELAVEFRDHPKRYVEEKTPFIHAMLMNARVWSQQVGWFPRASDM
ncbi:MAG: GrpB family protein [Bacteroidota bacterium]